MRGGIQRIKPFVLPAAIVLGLMFHKLCGTLTFVVPYLIFSILILSFSSTELRRLRFERIDGWLMAFLTVVTVVLYAVFRLLVSDPAVAEGMMLAALCPVASSVTVVACMLGAKPKNTVTYTIAGNLLICVLAPIIFVIVGHAQREGAAGAFLLIFWKIGTVIGLPFFIMLAMQLWAPSVSRHISRYKGLSFYLWAMALFLTLGQTINFIFAHGEGHFDVIAILGVGAAVLCPLQFYVGRRIGRKCGDAVAGQQLLGQKNSAMGIWMANTYLNPLASTFMAFYSVWQNVLNSWQIWQQGKSNKETQCEK